jgi:hypothetical protein
MGSDQFLNETVGTLVGVGEEFPELIEEYGIMGVPTLVTEKGRINAQVPDEVQILSVLGS